MLFFGGFVCFWGERTRDFAFVSLCYGRSGEEMCTGYMPWPPAAECNMITNKQTNRSFYDPSFGLMAGLGVYSTTRPRGLVMTYYQVRTAQIDLPASSNSYILEWNHHGSE